MGNGSALRGSKWFVQAPLGAALALGILGAVTLQLLAAPPPRNSAPSVSITDPTKGEVRRVRGGQQRKHEPVLQRPHVSA